MTDFLNVSINNNAAINNDILAVCQSITEHYQILIPSGPPLGNKNLHIVHNPSTPITFVKGLPQYYAIGITSNERFYSQTAYQFAHEITHIYCDPRITNWFIESLCEMASLYFLEYLSEKWETTPPYPNWNDYAPNFKNYKEERVKKVTERLGINNEDDLENKLRGVLEMIATPYDRDSNTVIALKLLSIFKENRGAWALLPLVGQASNMVLSDYSFIENSIPDFDKLVSLAVGENKRVASSIKYLMGHRI